MLKRGHSHRFNRPVAKTWTSNEDMFSVSRTVPFLVHAKHGYRVDTALDSRSPMLSPVADSKSKAPHTNALLAVSAVG